MCQQKLSREKTLCLYVSLARGCALRLASLFLLCYGTPRGLFFFFRLLKKYIRERAFYHLYIFLEGPCQISYEQGGKKIKTRARSSV